MKKQLLAFLIINCVFLLIGFKLKQKNPEELFLSDKNYQMLKEYRNYFGEDEVTFASGVNLAIKEQLENKVLNAGGDFVDISRMLPNHSVFTLPNTLDDEARYNFFQEASLLDPQLSFAGANFTNAHLAGMSLKIQKILFPLIFGVMFICLMLVFRNFNTTCYLFLTSFVGVSVGLSVVKVFFSYSTILTSLTPLVSFILTLANQMHVIFGIYTYQSKKEFLKHKLQPILIMMGTTIIGFAGLIYSDLISIRQFGIATSITLVITWALNLIFLSTFKINFNLPNSNWGLKIKRPKFSPKIGLLICTTLLATGIFSLKTMPTLVEAIFFFPENHPVRIGHKIIEKDLGGTPQVDIVITKKEQGDFAFDDYKKLAIFEAFLKTQKLPFNILSLNELIMTSNKIYSGNASLPDNQNAFFVLKSQIPEMLRTTLSANVVYKISLLSPPMSSQERKTTLMNLETLLKSLPGEYNAKLSGLNHLLLESQDYLVTTLLNSLIGSFLLIAFVFALFSRNIKEIFLFSIISLSSIFGGLLLMNIFGFTLNVSSIMVLSISIGLIDDSTIHLLYAQKHGESEEKIHLSCILPMMFSNLVLFVCFALLGIESFIPIKEFAWGLVLMLGMGLMLDLFVLPMFSRQKILNS